MPTARFFCSRNYATVLCVRSTVGAAALTRAIEEQIWAIDKNTLVFNPFMMSQILSDSLAQRRFTMSLLSGFGAVALLLAAIGIYGVLSCTVAQRTRDIGIRVFGVTSTDPATLGLVSAAVLAVAALAFLLPAWRATRVDPMVALRHQ